MSNDLISREALKKALHNFFDGKVIDEPTYILRNVFCYIDNAPTVPLPNEQIAWEQGYEVGLKDAERPIRCKDCKYTILSKDGKTLICCMTMKIGTVRPNFYCGNGEMKGGVK